MYLDTSGISCGIQELVSIGDPENRWDFTHGRQLPQRTLEVRYREAMRGAHCALVIASLTADQKEEIALLERHGFRRVGRPRRNPNTQHMIILFVKTIPQPRRPRRR